MIISRIVMIDEQKRIRELYNYHILDTPSERELDELAQIASAMCDTPISLVSLIDENRQWFKARKGIDVKETRRQDAFCQHALGNPKEVLIIDDPLNDIRFQNNPFVTGSPKIRFYAGAPLETPNGNVLGTLCVIDNKPRTISADQKEALKLLAKKAMDYLNTRKLIIDQNEQLELNELQLRKLTDQAPGIIFQTEISPDHKVSVPFISNGVKEFHAGLDASVIKKNPSDILKIIYPEDITILLQSLKRCHKTVTPWSLEFRVFSPTGEISWYWGIAKPEKLSDGSVVWYGTLQDISNRKEYEQALEQISFDISHVLRRPVTTMLGLTSVIERDTLSETQFRQYVHHIKLVAGEMDNFTRRLNAIYAEKAKMFEYRK